MMEPAVCSNCVKLAAALLEIGREAHDRGIDDTLAVVIKGLEVMKSRGLELCRIDDLIDGIKITAAKYRADRKG